LGVVALQQGDCSRAVELIGRAVAIAPNVAAFHGNLAEAYRGLGQLDRAAGCNRLALQLRPDYAEAAANLGVVLMAQGKHQAAADSFRQALAIKPDVAAVHNNLGNALRLAGDKEAARTAYERSVELDPGSAEAQTNLGQLLVEKGDADKALAYCREAVRLNPNLPEAHNNLGNALRESGDLVEAKAAYSEALRLNPSLAVTYNNVGQALQEEGKLGDAVVWYRQAIERDPACARIQANLASALTEQDKHDEAARHFEAALCLEPDNADAHNGLASVRNEQNRFEDALACVREAVRLRPGFAAAHANMGSILEVAGDLEAAQASWRDAIRLAPGYAAAHSHLATHLRDRLPEEEFVALERLLDNPKLTEGPQCVLHYGIAQVLDARGQYAPAADHLRKANALRGKLWRKRNDAYDPDRHHQFVNNLIGSFTPDYFERVRGFGLPSHRPIFVVGLPRSGTTLTEQVLASHSRVFGAGELRLIPDTFVRLPEILNRNETPPVECLPLLDPPAVQRIAQAHLDQLAERDATALRVVDKLPDNTLYLGWIATLFPNAKIVHCRRDLRDVALSCWMTNFAQLHWACDVDHIASRFRNYQRIMEHWRKVLPCRLLEIDYEEMIHDLESVSRRLMEWCGLEWQPACLDFHKTKRPVRTASVSQVRQPLYAKSAKRWKHYENALADLFSQLTQTL
jgi:tetratricopeptide (TPR) repeat protein